jgi:HEPN domain-containing protein
MEDNVKNNVDEWIAISVEDLEVAELCFQGRKYLHCAYMCQQSVEKSLKALIAANDEIPLPIHNLPELASIANVWDSLNAEQKFFLRALTTYAIEARYPERKRKLFQKCTKDEAEKLIVNTKEMLEWLETCIVEKLRLEKK